MARYLLDTTVLVDFSRERQPVQSRLLAMIAASETLGICAINVTEFYAGLPPDQWQRWTPFIESLEYWEISREAAIRAGHYRYHYARQGHTIALPDATVAAVAREQQAILITGNLRHFPMTDITVRSLDA